MVYTCDRDYAGPRMFDARDRPYVISHYFSDRGLPVEKTCQPVSSDPCNSRRYHYPGELFVPARSYLPFGALRELPERWHFRHLKAEHNRPEVCRSRVSRPLRVRGKLANRSSTSRLLPLGARWINHESSDTSLDLRGLLERIYPLLGDLSGSGRHERSRTIPVADLAAVPFLCCVWDLRHRESPRRNLAIGFTRDALRRVVVPSCCTIHKDRFWQYPIFGHGSDQPRAFQQH